jgi:hypothetical protein
MLDDMAFYFRWMRLSLGDYRTMSLMAILRTSQEIHDLASVPQPSHLAL